MVQNGFIFSPLHVFVGDIKKQTYKYLVKMFLIKWVKKNLMNGRIHERLNHGYNQWRILLLSILHCIGGLWIVYIMICTISHRMYSQYMHIFSYPNHKTKIDHANANWSHMVFTEMSSSRFIHKLFYLLVWMYCFNLFVTIGCVLCSVVIINVVRRGEHQRRFPAWIQKVCLPKKDIPWWPLMVVHFAIKICVLKLWIKRF